MSTLVQNECELDWLRCRGIWDVRQSKQAPSCSRAAMLADRAQVSAGRPFWPMCVTTNSGRYKLRLISSHLLADRRAAHSEMNSAIPRVGRTWLVVEIRLMHFQLPFRSIHLANWDRSVFPSSRSALHLSDTPLGGPPNHIRDDLGKTRIGCAVFA